MNSNISKISVIGSGSFGTALACHSSHICDVLLYGKDERITAEMNQKRTNSKYHGSFILPKNITATSNIASIIDTDIIIVATPSYCFAETIDLLRCHNLSTKTILLVATKGISTNPVELMSDKLTRDTNNPFAFIAGPNFANEIMLSKPTTTTIASHNLSLAKLLSEVLTTEYLRIDYTDDIITVQIASIVKNIVAIQSGILNAKYDRCENARAMLVTHAMQEIAKISNAFGGNAATMLRAAVIGDLVLTTYSETSRNTIFGYELHKSNYSKDFVKDYPILVEGVQSARLIGQIIDIDTLKIPTISKIVSLFT